MATVIDDLAFMAYVSPPTGRVQGRASAVYPLGGDEGVYGGALRELLCGHAEDVARVLTAAQAMVRLPSDAARQAALHALTAAVHRLEEAGA